MVFLRGFLVMFFRRYTGGSSDVQPCRTRVRGPVQSGWFP